LTQKPTKQRQSAHFATFATIRILTQKKHWKASDGNYRQTISYALIVRLDSGRRHSIGNQIKKGYSVNTVAFFDWFFDKRNRLKCFNTRNETYQGFSGVHTLPPLI
jgi:hypothetical protein